jgi:hypothetical protein
LRSIRRLRSAEAKDVFARRGIGADQLATASPALLPWPNRTICPRYRLRNLRRSGGPQGASRNAPLQKYKADTREMVKSLKLVDTVPIMLGAKPK